jgi:DNA-binding NarL/FixJ family response regulator
VRVTVADDDLLTRAGLVSLLTEAGCEVVGVAGNAAEAVRVAEVQRPDVAVLDIRMPPTFTTEGLGAAAEIQRRVPGTAVLVLSQYVEVDYALRLMAVYPDRVGYLLKERVVNVSTLVEQLARLAEGECVIDPSIVARLMRRQRRVNPLDTLTEREREVLDLIAPGHSNAGIARLLRVGERTVETQVTLVFTKLGLGETSQMNRRVLAVLRWLELSE